MPRYSIRVTIPNYELMGSEPSYAYHVNSTGIDTNAANLDTRITKS